MEFEMVIAEDSCTFNERITTWICVFYVIYGRNNIYRKMILLTFITTLKKNPVNVTDT